MVMLLYALTGNDAGHKWLKMHDTDEEGNDLGVIEIRDMNTQLVNTIVRAMVEAKRNYEQSIKAIADDL